MDKYPIISIVTPNYNGGLFLEETILSVINQNYPNLEYIIIDGGSKDNSIEIVKKYEKYITYWISEPDKGQSDAINKGFKKASGKWINWINSDDILMPNALKNLAFIIKNNPEYNWITGAKINLNQKGFYGNTEIPWQNEAGVLCFGYVLFPQDATFIRKQFLVENNIQIRTDFKNAMDTVLYYELIKIEKPLLTTAVFSGMRWHEAQKSQDLTNISRENKIAEEQFKKPLCKWQKIILRLTSTRYNALFNSCLKLLVYFGIYPETKKWKAYIYSHWSNSYLLVEARKLIKY